MDFLLPTVIIYLMTKIQKLKIFIDGASRGNPGPAAAGIIIFSSENKKIKEISETLGLATNNQAEYLALIRALIEAQKLGAREIEVFSDSELLVNQVKGLYKVRDENLKTLFKIAVWLKSDLKFSIHHIRREQNTLADNLANESF